MTARRTEGPDDAVLIRLSLEGDRVAFTRLIRRYEDTIFGYAYRVCRDRGKAEEVLQDTIINVHAKLGSFDGRSRFSTWLYSIVSNNCLMKKRRRKLEGIMESLDAPPAAGSPAARSPVARWDVTPEDVLLQRELRETLETAIAQLPLEYRTVFILRDVEGRTTEETAGIMHISVEAAKSRLRRARAFLRNALHPGFSDGAE
jgi:RNA polymerase sigma-70 factor (ECF subfamily)